MPESQSSSKKKPSPETNLEFKDCETINNIKAEKDLRTVCNIIAEKMIIEDLYTIGDPIIAIDTDDSCATKDEIENMTEDLVKIRKGSACTEIIRSRINKMEEENILINVCDNKYTLDANYVQLSSLIEYSKWFKPIYFCDKITQRCSISLQYYKSKIADMSPRNYLTAQSTFGMIYTLSFAMWSFFTNTVTYVDVRIRLYVVLVYILSFLAWRIGIKMDSNITTTTT